MKELRLSEVNMGVIVSTQREQYKSQMAILKEKRFASVPSSTVPAIGPWCRKPFFWPFPSPNF